MRVIYAALWAILPGLTWYEARLVQKARNLDNTSVALRERQVASVSRATALTVGAILGANRLVEGRLIPTRLVFPLYSLALGLNAIPAIRFIYLYYTRGFK